jgi:hypothetical protein
MDNWPIILHIQMCRIEKVLPVHVVKDDIESAFGNTIPLWAFGFLY